jgi:hypothetical protein
MRRRRRKSTLTKSSTTSSSRCRFAAKRSELLTHARFQPPKPGAKVARAKQADGDEEQDAEQEEEEEQDEQVRTHRPAEHCPSHSRSVTGGGGRRRR